MGNELVAVEQEEPHALNAEQVDLLKRTICKGTTNDEMKMFLQVCRNKKLDPFSRQIYAVKRGGSMTIQTGIDGFRAIAGRTGEADGQSDPEWCGADGVWVDVWLGNDAPAAARVRVYRKGHTHPYTAVAQHNFYFQASNPLWKKGGGAHMLSKCAEVLALRKAFPDDLAGLYSSEEMDQASTGGAPQRQEGPPRTLTEVAEPPHDEVTGEIVEPAQPPHMGLVERYAGVVDVQGLDTLKSDVREVWANLTAPQRDDIVGAQAAAVARLEGMTE